MSNNNSDLIDDLNLEEYIGSIVTNPEFTNQMFDTIFSTIFPNSSNNLRITNPILFPSTNPIDEAAIGEVPIGEAPVVAPLVQNYHITDLILQYVGSPESENENPIDVFFREIDSNTPVSPPSRPVQKVVSSPFEENNKSYKECKICMVNAPNFINIPCGHFSYCGECLDKAPTDIQKKCFLCKDEVEKFQQIFF